MTCWFACETSSVRGTKLMAQSWLPYSEPPRIELKNGKSALSTLGSLVFFHIKWTRLRLGAVRTGSQPESKNKKYEPFLQTGRSIPLIRLNATLKLPYCSRRWRLLRCCQPKNEKSRWLGWFFLLTITVDNSNSIDSDKSGWIMTKLAIEIRAATFSFHS